MLKLLHRDPCSIGITSNTCFYVPFSKTDKNIAPLYAITFGASARAIAATTFLPFTVVKTRFEVRLISSFY